MSTYLANRKRPTTEELIKLFQADDLHYNTEGSDIAKFYAGKCVFITGGTGFLGKLLVEKLLRACPDICGIYMLVRAKKGKDVHTRLDELFNDTVFQKLSKRQPKFRHKVSLVTGDVGLPGLGLSIEDRQTIIDKANVFIHSAATVKFHEKLHIAVDINIKGTREMLNLAKDSKHIECFVHISTAFVHAYKLDTDEKLYDIPYDFDKIVQICNSVPANTLDAITPNILGDYPNTYVFTKAIAENYLKKYSSQFPICVVRPSVVVPTYKEPLRSWIDNIYGATGIFLGAGVGIIRVAPINAKCTAEIVPADMVINCVIAGSYKTAIDKKTDVSVYNYLSSPQKPLTWNDYMHLSYFYGIQSPSARAVWKYTLRLVSNKYLYKIYVFFMHIIPAILMDTGLLLIGKKAQMLTTYKKVHKFSDTLNYFGVRNFTMKNNNTQKLYEDLSEQDKKLFFFDMGNLDWHDYFKCHTLGVRGFIIKEDISSISYAKKRYFRLQILHYALLGILYLILVRIAYAILSFLLF